ncbi:LexA/Signal peptidase [Suhomyces tanzawaensis NRRL Y-17324]|uniref:Mitochondrial inner membrane protease subunit n=1 Tax=Suhomyces tanzawaensis NRRL Y-17324 TaxID=984487 RepID=A0A1E4SI04_9ASCO|nr:LexA/Signal peptidase [Suhomyces tanzawaensis NRRL Y-17324]ODV79135.1 LexA/Signal peptidase [Suhomyces tanzawaensis NRRL Y-17324]
MSLRKSLLALTWIPVVYTFTNHVYQPYQIRGSSMSPTFNPGTDSTTKDIVLVSKLKVKETSFTRGDVIMFRSPENPEKILTKRVVGLQGDRVRPKSPYPKAQTVVPRNHLWVEGDNAFHSIDSNNFGPVSQGLVVGKVVTILWPLSRFGKDILGGRDARELDPKDMLVKLIGEI